MRVNEEQSLEDTTQAGTAISLTHHFGDKDELVPVQAEEVQEAERR